MITITLEGLAAFFAVIYLVLSIIYLVLQMLSLLIKKLEKLFQF